MSKFSDALAEYNAKNGNSVNVLIEDFTDIDTTTKAKKKKTSKTVTNKDVNDFSFKKDKPLSASDIQGIITEADIEEQMPRPMTTSISNIPSTKIRSLEEGTATQYMVQSTKNTLDLMKNEVMIKCQDNSIQGEPLDDYIFQHFLNRIDPIEYCENVLRGHLPEKQKHLHENQTALIRAVCNPNLKRVVGMMSRQCIAKGSIIHTCDGKLIPIEEAIDYFAHLTISNATIYELITDNGAQINATANHPVFTDRGWVKIVDLTLKDKIYCLKEFNKFGQGIDDDILLMLGMTLISYVNNDYSIFNNSDVIKVVSKLLKTEYTLNINIEYLVKEFYHKNIQFMSYNIPSILNECNREQIVVFLTTIQQIYGTKIVVKNLHFAEFIRELLNKLGFYNAEVVKYDNGYGIKFNHIKHNDVKNEIDGEQLTLQSIRSITRLKEKCDVYDITVVNKGWFICGGMQVHNSGKCFAKGTQILMANGKTKSVEDIVIGDKVMTPYSTSATVTALGHGIEEMYEIKPNEKNHESFTVNKSHILALKIRSKGKKYFETLSVEEYLQMPMTMQKNSYGYRVPVEFEERPLNIDAYFIGLWLGYGEDNKTEFVTNDEPIIEYLQEYSKQFNVHCIVSQQVINNKNVTRVVIAGKNNKLLKILKNNKLINNKHIPDNILYNSINIRRQCLAGIIDSIGNSIYDNKNSTNCKLTLYNYILAENIKLLARSIGLRTNIYTKTQTVNGVRTVSYQVCMSGTLSLIPSKLPWKQFNDVKKYNALDFNFEVVPKGIGEYFGFTIDSIDKLFLLGDYTVTHNTESIASFGGFLIDNYPNMRVGVFTPRLQQAEVSIGRLSTFFQMNEDRLNNKIVKLTKDKIELDNNSFITAVSASDQSNIEGLTFDVIVLDEAQKVSNYTMSERITPMGGGCITGDSLIALCDGTVKTIEDIVKNKDVDEILSVDIDTRQVVHGKIIDYHDTGVYDTLKITLFNGYTLCGTDDHPVIINNTWTRLDNVKVGDKIAIFNNIHYNNFGDMDVKNARQQGITSILYCQLPLDYLKWNRQSICELLGGIFDTVCAIHKDGIYCNIFLTSVAEQIQELLGKFNIDSEYIDNTIIVKNKASINNFYSNITLLVPYKKKQLQQIVEFEYMDVKNVENTGKQHVYDLTIDKYHSFIANGIFVHNTNAKIVKIGTPKTKNHFYDSVEGKASSEWVVIKRDWTQTPQNWVLEATYLPDPETGVIRPYSSFILNTAMPKSLKQEMFPNNPEIWTEGELSVEDFRTQYMLEFVDGAGKFLDSKEVELLTSGEYEWLDHGVIGEYYVAGIDFAGSNPEGDVTQVTVLRVTPNGIKQKVYAREFKEMSYPQQMYEISRLFGGMNPKFEVKKIFADYTGCGAPIIQTLKEEFGILNLEGIIFNQTEKFTHSGMNMKNYMYGKWKQELDNGRFQYPKKESFLKSIAFSAGKDNISYYLRMVGEWADLEFTTTTSVNKKIEAPRGYHDDVCDADVLANFAIVHSQRSRMPRPTSGRFTRF